MRTVLQAGFRIAGVVVDADYGANAALRDGLEQLGLAYGVAIRGEATFTITDGPGPLCRHEGVGAANMLATWAGRLISPSPQV
ncbi:hypothetical protein D3C83_101190 [compost metagenome]